MGKSLRRECDLSLGFVAGSVHCRWRVLFIGNMRVAVSGGRVLILGVVWTCGVMVASGARLRRMYGFAMVVGTAFLGSYWLKRSRAGLYLQRQAMVHGPQMKV